MEGKYIIHMPKGTTPVHARSWSSSRQRKVQAVWAADGILLACCPVMVFPVGGAQRGAGNRAFG